MKAGVTDGFGVPGENDYGRRVTDFCVERGLSVSDTYFKYRSLQGGLRPRWSRNNERDRSGSGEDRYAVLCAGCEGNKRNGQAHQITILYCVKLGRWMHRL